MEESAGKRGKRKVLIFNSTQFSTPGQFAARAADPQGGNCSVGWVWFGNGFQQQTLRMPSCVYAMGVVQMLLHLPKSQEWSIYLFLYVSPSENGCETL